MTGYSCSSRVAAADSGLLSPELAAGIRRVKGLRALAYAWAIGLPRIKIGACF
jgi:hypothetical protein